MRRKENVTVLKASYHGGSGWFGVRDSDGVVTSSRFHNHFQSSGERNTSSAHSRSTLLVCPFPAALSWHTVMTISFPCGKGSSSRAVRERVGSLGQLVDSGISGGKGFSRGGGSGRVRGVGISSGVSGWIAVLLASLHYSLH